MRTFIFTDALTMKSGLLEGKYDILKALKTTDLIIR